MAKVRGLGLTGHTRRAYLVVLLVSVCACAIPQAGEAAPSAASMAQPGLEGSGPRGPELTPNEKGIVPGHYVVVLKDSVEHPGTVAERQTRRHDGSLGFVYRYALTGYSAELSRDAVTALRDNPRVESIRPDHGGELFAQTTPTGISRVFAPQNSNLDIDGVDDIRVDANVAVVDGGIDSTHPDLNVVGSINCYGDIIGEGEDNPGCTSAEVGVDDYGHGTHVAGTIGALDNGIGVVGVAPGVRLWGVRVFDEGTNFLESWAVAGIDWITKTREDANPSNDIDVVNMSLGCRGPSCWPTVDEAIDASQKKGVIYVVSAGNSNVDANNAYPARDPNVLTVSALADSDGSPGGNGPDTCVESARGSVPMEDDVRASFSNFGSAIDLAAPGVCIMSTVPLDGLDYAPLVTADYAAFSGTSMAAPHVAGAAAIAVSGWKSETLEDVLYVNEWLRDHGNLDWTDTSGDGHKESLLDVSSESFFPIPLPPTQAALTIERTGTGSGTVTSSPAGISCGSTCSADFSKGSEVTLTATAASGPAGSVFTGWSGGGCSGTGNCTVTMDEAKTVQAEFTAFHVKTLTASETGTGMGTVKSVPSGATCGIPCTEITAAYDNGTVVTLTAVPKTDSVFAGWSGDCEGTGTCTVTMSKARSVTAQFNGTGPTAVVLPLTVEKPGGTGTGKVTSAPGGIACIANCISDTALYKKNAVVTLKAAPSKNSTFAGWSGCESEVKGDCVVTMSKAKSVEAEFALLPRHLLTVSKAGGGQGTARSVPSGAICGTTCSTISTAYYQDAVVELTATPKSGSIFTGWSGGGCSGTGSCIVTMSEAQSVTAEFTGSSPTLIPLTVEKAVGAGTGKVASSPGGISCIASTLANCVSDTAGFKAGTVVTLTATASKGSTSTGWAGCESEPKVGECVVTMSKAKSVTAKFK